MKKSVIIAVSVVLVIGLGAGVYWWMTTKKTDEASLACVATSFPYIVMEHKRSELTGMLDNLKVDEDGEPDLEAVEEKMAAQGGKPDKFFLSEEIDTKMLGIADSMQAKGPGSTDPEEMTKMIKDLIPIFQSQASNYLNDCRSLFSEIVSECGSFENSTEEAQKCREKYDPRVSAMLQEHISSTPPPAE